MINHSVANRNVGLRLGRLPSSSAASLESLEVSDASNNSQYIVFVTSIPVNSPREFETNQTSNVAETFLEIPGSSYILVNVFNRQNLTELSARVSYSITVSNSSSLAQNSFPFNPSTFLSSRRVVNNLQHACNFYSLAQTRFSSQGCSLVRSSDNFSRATCLCNHTTAFAVLLSVNHFTVSTEIRVSISLKLLMV